MSKPIYKDGVLTVEKDKLLLTEKEIEFLVSFKGAGKDFFWNTNWIDIGDGRMYLG